MRRRAWRRGTPKRLKSKLKRQEKKRRGLTRRELGRIGSEKGRKPPHPLANLEHYGRQAGKMSKLEEAARREEGTVLISKPGEPLEVLEPVQEARVVRVGKPRHCHDCCETFDEAPLLCPICGGPTTTKGPPGEEHA